MSLRTYVEHRNNHYQNLDHQYPHHELQLGSGTEFDYTANVGWALPNTYKIESYGMDNGLVVTWEPL